MPSLRGSTTNYGDASELDHAELCELWARTLVEFGAPVVGIVCPESWKPALERAKVIPAASGLLFMHGIPVYTKPGMTAAQLFYSDEGLRKFLNEKADES